MNEFETFVAMLMIFFFSTFPDDLFLLNTTAKVLVDVINWRSKYFSALLLELDLFQ